ncbi:alpha/beta fold hydrolase [Nocardioides cavernaquae]|uniref:Alpha/beta hydrolase n=1 Tax=Nocardioides cavernaquae TaxID=2321396 RepID=A0A3A5HAF9_9ACTN|nr:alpha/beta hydrolase [Nocardioides cavernaquae]RJS47021.1 alpha/beta hydrolase [Nocardioides cavernaquae]
MDFVLIPGATGRAWYWHLVAPRLEAAGHRVISVELPADDDTKGLTDYAQAVIDAAGTTTRPVVVAASLGGFTAPLVAGPLDTTTIILVNAMVPLPGEMADDWWGDTGMEKARIARARRLGYPVEFELDAYFLHDVDPDVIATADPKADQSDRPMRDPCAFETWPARVIAIAGRDDRFFPLEFQQDLARTRLGVEPIVVPGGHLVALSHPEELTAAILKAADSEGERP